MWEPRRLTILWALTACYKDTFNLSKVQISGMPKTKQGRADYIVIWESIGNNLKAKLFTIYKSVELNASLERIEKENVMLTK
jgi:hypothetical protein